MGSFVYSPANIVRSPRVSAPLLGPSLGPILGGVLTQAFSWRATFWFLAIFAAIIFLLFVPFKDSYRRERSLTYQNALKKRRAHMLSRGSETSSLSQATVVSHAVPSANEARPNDKNAHDRLPRNLDVEKQQEPVHSAVSADIAPMNDIKLTFADVNPAKPIWHVLRRINNLTIMVTSGTFLCSTIWNS